MRRKYYCEVKSARIIPMGDVKFGFSAKDIIAEQRVSEEDVDLIRTFVGSQELPNLTDEQLILFLLSCQRDQALTRKTILAYYSIKKKSPTVFDDRNMERDDLKRQLEVLRFCVFPKRTEDGCAIIYHRLYNTTYSNYDMRVGMKLLFMTLDAAIYDDPPKGLVILFDMKGVGLMHLTTVKLDLLKTFFSYLQEALPVRLKSVHVLNSVYFLSKVMSLISPFIKAEVFEQIHFHTSNINMEDFYKNCISQECLPADYGGFLPCVDILHGENIKKCSDMKKYFQAEEEQRNKI